MSRRGQSKNTVLAYMHDNTEPFYGLDVKSEVCLYPLFYQNLIVTSLFDLKLCTTQVGRTHALAFMYFGVHKLLNYTGSSALPLGVKSKHILAYYINVYELEKRLMFLGENMNKWLLAVTDYDTLGVIRNLREMLYFMENIAHLNDATMNDVATITKGIFNKKWKLPETSDSIQIELRRLDRIRKKYLSIDAAAGRAASRQLEKELCSILNTSTTTTSLHGKVTDR